MREDSAEAYLKELMRHEDVRRNIVKTLPEATRTQKTDLCWIFADSKSPDLLPALNQLGSDSDVQVSTSARRAAHVIQQAQAAPQ